LAEIGAVGDVIRAARHPYTRGLMGAIPKIGGDAERLVQIEGSMPGLTQIPAGCAFHPRCPEAFDRCREQRPDLMIADGSRAACWLYARDGATAEPGNG
jgi:peptide/nickel transport system ATP-binding protein